MKNIVKQIIPPDKWRLSVLIIVGVFFGFAAYALYLSKFPSYLSDSPETCVNCHIMGPEYASWSHSSHRIHATCNDCHVPHNNIFNKYFFKAKDGMRHATIFTLRTEPQAIIIKEASKRVVQQNCERCHTYLLNHNKDKMNAALGINKEEDEDEGEDNNERKCWDCHRETPHGKVKSISSAPNAYVPLPKSPVPEWLNSLMNKEKTNNK